MLYCLCSIGREQGQFDALGTLLSSGQLKTLKVKSIIAAQLSMENGHVFVVLCGEEIARHRTNQFVFLDKVARLEAESSRSAVIARFSTRQCQFSWLLEDESHVSMQARSLWRSRTDILGKCFPLSHLISRNIYYQPKCVTNGD